MERVILARHGETVWNVERRVNGDPSQDVHLSASGREESRRLGEELEGEALDLCVTTPFRRTQETADLALAGRPDAIPRLVVPELGDPRYGDCEGLGLDDYRAWARAQASSVAPPGGGESRRQVAARYAVGFRRLLDRPETAILAVCHSLPIAYALGARDGSPPEPRAPMIANAHPYPFAREELERAAGVLEGWCTSPTW
jgi:broad specificity phosphatase PhoE